MLSAAKLARCLTPLRFVLYGKQATAARGLVWAKKAIATTARIPTVVGTFEKSLPKYLTLPNFSLFSVSF